MDTLDEAGDGKDGDHPDSEWLAGNGAHIAIEDDQGNLPEFRNPGDPTGRRWIGSFSGAPGELERISYTHVVTASDVASDNGNPYVAVADFKNTVKREDNRRVSYRLDARMNGATMASSEKIYFANGTEVQTGDIDVGAAASGWAVDGVEVQDVNSGIFSASIAAGDTIGLRLFGLANDPGSQDKNLGVAMSNLRVVQLADGDTNGDTIVDAMDIQNILGAGGLQASGATWATGDNDQDGDVDSTDIQNILAQGAFPNDYVMAPGSDGDGTVDLLFDGAQGLSIDTDGATINGFILSSSTGVLAGSAADLSDVPGFFVTDTDEEISSQFGYAFNGVTDLGEVLAPGLSLDDLAADLTMTYTVEGQSGVFDATIVPEPMTMSLLAVGGLGVLIRRKRR
jgi:hypothetical protein